MGSQSPFDGTNNSYEINENFVTFTIYLLFSIAWHNYSFDVFVLKNNNTQVIFKSFA